MSKQGQQKLNPLLASLPEYVKDPRNYDKIQRALLETLACGKIHSDPSQMFHCKKCNENLLIRRQLMNKYGFKSSAQYLAWKQVHEEIKNKMPLDMYNRMVKDGG